MISALFEPFAYSYMTSAIWVGGMVGALCGFLSAFLMLKGWSLIGDALSHSVVPGVAGAYILGLPFALGAFVSGGLAALAMLIVSTKTDLKQDTIIGIIFTGFFSMGLFMVSLNPTSVDVQSIIMGNILAISPFDRAQLIIICFISAAALLLLWRDLLAVFFDETHAKSLGLNTGLLRIIFFAILAAATVAAMQTVGAFLVIALVVTPGATAYLLSDKFSSILWLSSIIGFLTCALGAYISYFLNGVTGGVIICLQSLVFGIVFILAPKHGLLAQRRNKSVSETR